MTRSRRLEVQLGVPVMLDAGVPAFGAQLDVASRRRARSTAETGCGVSKPNVHPTVRVSGLPTSRGTPFTLLRRVTGPRCVLARLRSSERLAPRAPFGVQALVQVGEIVGRRRPCLVADVGEDAL